MIIRNYKQDLSWASWIDLKRVFIENLRKQQNLKSSKIFITIKHTE